VPHPISSSVPGSSALVRSLFPQFVVTSSIVSRSPSSLSTLPSHSSTLLSSGQLISPEVPSRNLSRTAPPQWSTYPSLSPHSWFASTSRSNTSRLKAPSSYAPNSTSPPHGSILSTNRTPHSTASHSTARPSSTRPSSMARSSLSVPTSIASRSTAPHSLTRSSGHSYRVNIFPPRLILDLILSQFMTTFMYPSPHPLLCPWVAMPTGGRDPGIITMQ
jgi:hypothetical protein